MFAELDCNACWEGSLHLACGKTWWSIQDIFYKSKTSSCFPNFDTSNAWQIGHMGGSNIRIDPGNKDGVTRIKMLKMLGAVGGLFLVSFLPLL